MHRFVVRIYECKCVFECMYFSVLANMVLLLQGTNTHTRTQLWWPPRGVRWDKEGRESGEMKKYRHKKPILGRKQGCNQWNPNTVWSQSMRKAYVLVVTNGGAAHILNGVCAIFSQRLIFSLSYWKFSRDKDCASAVDKSNHLIAKDIFRVKTDS